MINIVVMKYEFKKGKELCSDILVCDSVHTKSDIFVSLAVIVTLISTKIGFPIIDTIIALVIGGLIAKAGYEVLRKSSVVLTDGEAVEKAKIAEVVKAVTGVKAVHKIRTRGRDDDIHVDLHVMVDKNMPVKDAHCLSHEISVLLKVKISGVTDVIVHVEPSL
jgi:cation diffusion facilitator family transporter